MHAPPRPASGVALDDASTATMRPAEGAFLSPLGGVASRASACCPSHTSSPSSMRRAGYSADAPAGLAVPRGGVDTPHRSDSISPSRSGRRGHRRGSGNPKDEHNHPHAHERGEHGQRGLRESPQRSPEGALLTEASPFRRSPPFPPCGCHCAGDARMARQVTVAHSVTLRVSCPA
jgi:hypothetical protein